MREREREKKKKQERKNLIYSRIPFEKRFTSLTNPIRKMADQLKENFQLLRNLFEECLTAKNNATEPVSFTIGN